MNFVGITRIVGNLALFLALIPAALLCAPMADSTKIGVHRRVASSGDSLVAPPGGQIVEIYFAGVSAIEADARYLGLQAVSLGLLGAELLYVNRRLRRARN